jgi:hypothetical protein
MDLEELLSWTDDQVFSHTGKHLDSLQKSILQGLWQHQDYEEIADNNHRSYNHIKKEAWKLWKILSKVFNENIKQSNVKAILETKYKNNIYNFGECTQIISNSKINTNHINICPEKKQSLEYNQPPPQSSNQTPIIDLTNAPEIPYNYHNRTSELSTLKQWILEEHSKLITIYGLTGIGKTALTLKLISEIKTKFDYIIYRSFDNIPTFLNLQNDLKKTFYPKDTNSLSTILDYFRSYRCLIILDDLHHIFKPHELAGEYLTEYQDYGQFFKQISTLNHQSCLILISWELSQDIINLQDINHKTQILHLQGIGEDAKDIFKAKNLKDEEKWSELIKIYQGHPTWLNIISSTINKLCQGNVNKFLAKQEQIYLGNIKSLLSTQIDRLSPTEQQVIYAIATQNQPIDITETPSEIEISQSQWWENIESLIRRGLLAENPETSQININSVIKEYIKHK